MPIEDYDSKNGVKPTRQPPSRARAMLLDLRRQLEIPTWAQKSYQFEGFRVVAGAQLLPEIDEALEEWKRLDALIIQEREQRKRIAARISSFIEFVVKVRDQIRFAQNKKRRPLTSEQKVIARAKLRATRKARGTLGKRQKKKIRGW